MTIHTLKLRVTNCYLVRAGERFLLVDTGYEYEWERFCQRLSQAGVGLEEIGYVVLTHHHDDHAGLISRLVEANPEVKVILSHHGEALLAGGRNAHAAGAGYVNRRIGVLLALKGRLDKKWMHTFPPYQARAVDILLDGETTFEALGIPLCGRIIETPGHSPDHLSILFDSGDCLAGDAAANFLQWAGAKYCIIAVDNLDLYYASWQTLIAGRAERIFPSHGKPFAVEELRRHLDRHKKGNMMLFKETH
jgi:hydroxyacylglutathione hydrolase